MITHHYTQNIDLKFRSRSSDKPFFIVGNTVKGKGVSYMENKPIWHYRSPSKLEHKKAMKELDKI